MLFNETFYGPVHSRRLGYSLGINLLPKGRKICNYDCIYCECGLNNNNAPKLPLPEITKFEAEFESVLNNFSKQKQIINHITFSGNGEPTLHPNFDEIINITIKLRNKIYPEAKIAVLTNSTMVCKDKIFNALKKIDLPICKLDAGSNEMYHLIDQPVQKLTLDTITETLTKFKGNLYIQTIFLKGIIKDKEFDNSTDEEVNLWLKRLKIIMPKFVMIYSLDRIPPYSDLQNVAPAKLKIIAERVKPIGIDAEAFYK